MGCDIHAHGEVKINGVWHHWNQPIIDRDYRLFGYMAGVRDEGVRPIVEPRGLPEDATLLTKLDSDKWNGDGHTHSWLSGKEIAALAKIVDKEFSAEGKFFSLEHHAIGYVFGNGWDVNEYPEDRDCYPPGVEDTRLVFWFDN